MDLNALALLHTDLGARCDCVGKRARGPFQGASPVRHVL